jgi:hypothetical protein
MCDEGIWDGDARVFARRGQEEVIRAGGEREGPLHAVNRTPGCPTLPSSGAASVR